MKLELGKYYIYDDEFSSFPHMMRIYGTFNHIMTEMIWVSDITNKDTDYTDFSVFYRINGRVDLPNIPDKRNIREISQQDFEQYAGLINKFREDYSKLKIEYKD